MVRILAVTNCPFVPLFIPFPLPGMPPFLINVFPKTLPKHFPWHFTLWNFYNILFVAPFGIFIFYFFCMYLNYVFFWIISFLMVSWMLNWAMNFQFISSSLQSSMCYDINLWIFYYLEQSSEREVTRSKGLNFLKLLCIAKLLSRKTLPIYTTTIGVSAKMPIILYHYITIIMLLYYIIICSYQYSCRLWYSNNPQNLSGLIQPCLLFACATCLTHISRGSSLSLWSHLVNHPDQSSIWLLLSIITAAVGRSSSCVLVPKAYA